MPLYCSNTGNTALRDAEVQQPNTAATLSFTSSFLDFSAKVGQSLAPSSWMNSILRPSTPPMALIWSIASFSACTEPVSMIAMVPVTECRMPTFTLLSVTASPVVFTSAVDAASAEWPSNMAAGRASMPRNIRRRSDEWVLLEPGNFVSMVQPLRQSIGMGHCVSGPSIDCQTARANSGNAPGCRCELRQMTHRVDRVDGVFCVGTGPSH